MASLEQYTTYFVRLIDLWFPGAPPSLLLFAGILAGFLALVLVLVVLRLFLGLIAAIFGLKRRQRVRRRRIVNRPVPARLYSTNWHVERERRRREFLRRLK